MAYIKERICKDGSRSYQAEVKLAGFPPKYKTFDKKKDAAQWARRTENDLREGNLTKAAKAKIHTAGEMITRYIETVLQTKTDRESYRKNQNQQLLWWKAQIGNYDLANLRTSVIAEARDSLVNYGGRKRKAATINRYLAALSHVLKVAYKEWEWLPENPITNVKKMNEPRGRVRFLTKKERTRLLAACRKYRKKPLYQIVMLALASGPRKNEILTLRRQSVDLKRQSIVLEHTKNGERRSCHISERITRMLADYLHNERIVDGYIFPAIGRRRPVNIDYEFRAAVKAAGIKDFRFHDLRHSAASELAMNGATLMEIAEFLGHKTLSMVKRYSHLLKEHSASVVDRMNDAIFQDEPEQPDESESVEMQD